MERNATHSGLDRADFDRAWRQLGAIDGGAFDVLDAYYAEPHRAYHNAEHIADCVGWLAQIWELAERPDELAVAIYFHDAIYKPRAGDNEAASAQLFREQATTAGVDTECMLRVAALIESTVRHSEVRGDGALLSDIDLAILGASPARYRRYEADVRREYADVPQDEYRAGRARVLMEFLERLEIYKTPYFASRLETQARANLSAALTALAEGGT